MRFFLSLILFLIVAAAKADENWPGWRGPRGDGTVRGAPNLPVDFDIAKDTVWKTKIPGVGHASPVIWEDRIFLVSADEESQARSLMCFDRISGEIKWSKGVLQSPFEDIHRLNSRASSTPVTDGERIFVSFLDGEKMFVAAYDLEGNQLWQQRPGVFSSKHGYCSCPVLWKNMVIVNGDHDGEAYIVALDQKSGETIWKTERPNKLRSYCTPIIREIDGRTQLILSGSESVASYDPENGTQHWVIDGPTEQFVASLVYNEDLNLLFMTCGFPQKHMFAIRPDGSGNVTKTHVVWRDTAGASYVPSPIAIGDYFLVVADNGVASCFVAETGERHWRERLPGGHSASIIAANGLAYFISDEGIVSVLKPGPEFKVIAQSEVGENVYASPAVYGDQFFIRGEEHLFCIGK
ncbi:PQQ-binding-like beta-propeller repeat protein [bacterium]|jgi:outer membrane protein assembly factor BamB|nr:PQQ-binding-like beta-propeller repeat protein [Verrucomicrobiales bacterium]MDB3940157.1 PQQ-binding-like beta-propeller repeat protein [Verrucomicrobiales bacterium]MDC0252215.1 PQQ-binding-like beta-propeller repeat protein [bacterium]MDC3352680.1 PQQ-binding-like beta-propeller repeat protein [Verrucomicrobiales bacterium]